MASREMNDAKRAEMAKLAHQAAHMYGRALLRRVMGISASTLSAWMCGRSMGSNAERADLRDIVDRGRDGLLLVVDARIGHLLNARSWVKESPAYEADLAEARALKAEIAKLTPEQLIVGA